tara:strand:- start:94 stop:486 length:393 start_codon:yes stop_codon:yes gene_type:complete
MTYFVPGQRSTLSILSVPTLLIAAALYAAYKTKEVAATKGAMACDEKYCPPTYQIHVDAPRNTLLKDQSNGAGLRLNGVLAGHAATNPGGRHAGTLHNATMKDVYQTTKRDYFTEAVNSSGVRLVAHAIA